MFLLPFSNFDPLPLYDPGISRGILGVDQENGMDLFNSSFFVCIIPKVIRKKKARMFFQTTRVTQQHTKFNTVCMTVFIVIRIQLISSAET